MELRSVLDESTLERVAQDLGLKLKDYVKHGNRCRFTLKHTTSVIGKTKYVKKGWSGQRVNSACLHGYTMFMIHVFEKDPDASFKSVYGVVNKENITSVYGAIAYNNVGSMIAPVYYTNACYCDYKDVAKVVEKLLK